MSSDMKIVEQTQCWLNSIIIEHNLCPFAKRERDRGSIHFSVDDSTEIDKALEHLLLECERLEQDTDIETSLLIFSQICQDFDDFLDLLDLANQLLITQDDEGIFQLASFHPDYLFAGSFQDDPANYTNRSPYPMLHIIREASLEKALLNYPHPELIPERNMEFCRTMGIEKMREMLAHCRNKFG